MSNLSIHKHNSKKKSYSIALVACEPSGDLLAADLINSINADKHNQVEISFFGVTGPKMEQAGCDKVYSIDELSVMGIFEIIKYLPKLIKLRKKILNIILDKKPDLVIAIDAPDFNLGLEKKIKNLNNNIKTIHYVSPSIWAWRKNRIKTIKKGVDKVLCLFPFEVHLYNDYNIPANYVGHPLAKKYKFRDNIKKNESRDIINHLNAKDIVIGLLPGSRKSEIEAIFPVLIKFLEKYKNNFKNIKFVIALSNNRHENIIESNLQHLKAHDKNFSNNILVHDNSEQVLYASDLILCASGTVTLEAALIGVPMVVVYYLSSFTWLLTKLLVSSKYAALPNIISNKLIVPELLQKNFNVDNLYYYTNKLLNDIEYKNQMINNLEQVKNTLCFSEYESISKIVLESL